MSLIILLLLSEDEGFNSNIHNVVSIAPNCVCTALKNIYLIFLFSLLC